MNNHYEVINEKYCISTDKLKLNIDLIHRYLTEESYWAQGITKAIVEKSIAHSICFGIYDEHDQIGFARLVTDRATFAYLADVFIVTSYRGRGLGKWLMQTILAHPELQGLRRWLLGTKDAHGLYEQFGWTRLSEEASRRFMQIHNPDVYKKV